MRNPEVGTSVKRFVGFLNHYQFQSRIRFGWFAADEIADEYQSGHPKLRHFFSEALKLAFEHASALAAKAEHHWGHRVNLRAVGYISTKANREI